MARCGSRVQAARLALALLAAGCIDTELPEPAPEWLGWPCGVSVSEQTASEAVVLVITTRPEGLLPPTTVCSGVAIAPELVLTSRHCAVAAASAQPVRCDRTSGWLPLAEEQRTSYLGDSLDVPGNIRIVTGADPEAASALVVEEVVVSDATSFCVDNFALLVLRSALDLEPVPVRLGANTRLGEEVRLSGFGGGPSPVRRRVLPAVVSSIVSDRGSVRAPPRSLLLEGGACSYDRGGAVFSPETGALLGTIVENPLSSCDPQEGMTLAVNLARHANFLLEAAAVRGITLRTELRSELVGSQHACAAE